MAGDYEPMPPWAPALCQGKVAVRAVVGCTALYVALLTKCGMWLLNGCKRYPVTKARSSAALHIVADFGAEILGRTHHRVPWLCSSAANSMNADIRYLIPGIRYVIS